MSGQCDFDLEMTIYQPSSDVFSNLSGVFFFFSPLSFAGAFAAQMVRPMPYLLAGRTWALGRNHEGRSALTNDAEGLIRDASR